MKETPLASNIFDFLYNDVTLKARTDIIESQAYETFVSIVQNCQKAEWVEARVNEFIYT